MRRLLRGTYFVRGLALLLSCATAIADPPGFKRIRVTDTPDDVERNPRINDRGDIVWSTRINHDPDNLQEIFLYSGGVTTRLTDDRIGDALPDINENGVVVWIRATGPKGPYGPTAEIVRCTDGQLDKITDDAYDDFGPRINSNGEIVWYKYNYKGCDGSNRVAEFYDGSTVLNLTDGSHADQGVTINDAGQVVWTRYDFCSDPWQSEIILRDPDGTTQVLSDGYEPQAVSINSRGSVTWTDLHSLYLWSDGVVTRITDNGISSYLNAKGDIAFSTWNDDRQTDETWLYIGGDIRPIASSDNREVPFDMNERGDIVVLSYDAYLTASEIFLYQRLPDGDLNCDESVNFDDIDGFVDAITDRASYESHNPTCDWWLADCNGDRHIDFNDIDPFVTCLINNGCP